MKKIDKEHYLINRLSSKYIGDDAAVIGDTLYSMDAFFEDVHFKRKWMSLAQIGRKANRRTHPKFRINSKRIWL
jgi:thiamine-monophosphate kinase